MVEFLVFHLRFKERLMFVTVLFVVMIIFWGFIYKFTVVDEASKKTMVK